MPASVTWTNRSSASIAIRVALIYLVLGLSWIIGSDLYLYYSAGGNAAFPTTQILKGSAFVALSALVVFALVYWFNATSHGERRRRETIERGYRALVDSTPDAVFIIDPEDGRVLDANRAAEELFGLSRRRLIGLDRSSHTDTEDPAFHDFQEERLKTGRARAVLRMIRGDGSRFPADVSSAVFHDERGRLRASVVIRDISAAVERQQALEASEARLSELSNLQQGVLNAVFAHIVLVDREGRVEFANERWQRYAEKDLLPALGTGLEANLLGRLERYRGADADAARRIAEALRSVLSGSTERAEFEFSFADGDRPRWHRIAITPYAVDDRKGAVVAHLDVTDRRAAEARRRLVDAAFQSTDEAILICDENFLVLDANEAYLRATGFEREDALQSKPSFLEIGEQARAVGQALETHGHWRGDLIQRRVTGETFVSLAAVNVVRQSEDEPQRLVVTFSDVSGLREAEERIHHLSYHDPITNLPNRAALNAWFAENVENGPAGRTLALIYLDLDRFKIVNESFGHAVGDELLREIGRRLRRETGPKDALGRLGGDEFLFVVDGVDDEREAVRHARRLLERIAEPVELEARGLHVTAAAGVTLFPDDGLSLDDLLRQADAAAHKVKREGRRGGVSRFQQEMRKTVDRQMRVERGLRKAVAKGELSLVFQPIVALSDGVLCGTEALLRWDSPELGPVGPAEFIAVAEDSGLITEIGYWVLDKACEQFRRWRGLSTRLEHLGVNISMAQFHQPGLVEQVETVLQRHDLPGDALVLEITESVMMLDPEWTVEVLGRLQAMGISVAIDDFGAGYSSMAYLRDLPVQFLKIDRSFINRLPHSRRDADIMSCIIALAHRLGMRVVAEGIEKVEQLEQLQEWGCEEGQGFLFDRPLSAADLGRRLREGDIRLTKSKPSGN